MCGGTSLDRCKIAWCEHCWSRLAGRGGLLVFLSVCWVHGRVVEAGGRVALMNDPKVIV